MRITIIGRGRLGRSLDILFQNAGHQVSLVGRSGPLPEADVVLLAVPDDAIASAATRVPGGPVLLHCSGARDVDVLRPHSPAGSFHPLMTFPGPEIQLPTLTGVPAAVAGDPPSRAMATELAEDLGMAPFEVPGDRRLYHAAAVLAGNGATVLLGEACRVLAAAGVPPDQCAGILAPLALRSISNRVTGTRQALTGPVSRGDLKTLDAHREALHEHHLDGVRGLYEVLIQRARLQLATPGADDLDDS